MDNLTPIELVVSKYKEDISWTQKVSSKLKITTYDKSTQNSINSLPNVGRESHTYLHHIISRWDSLAEITVFCQGNPFDHCHNFIDILNSMKNEYFFYNFLGILRVSNVDDKFIGYGPLLTCTKYGLPHSEPVQLPIPQDCQYLGLNCTEEISFYAGAQFSVHKDIIKKRPLQFYQNAIQLVNKDISPISGYSFERLWHIIFG